MPRKGSEDATCPLWMMTFGDCMSLLVTFFVMLIAFSNVEKEKLMPMIGAMKGALGMTPAPLEGVEKMEAVKNYERIRGLSMKRRWLSLEQLSAVIPDSQMAVRRFGRPRVGNSTMYVLVRMLQSGMAFIVHTKALFEEGRAEVVPGNEELFGQIGHLAVELENEIRIVGVVTEDTTVTSSRFKTPLGLGIERALAVKEALIRVSNFADDRFSISSRMAEADDHGGDKDIPVERVEIVIIGRHDLKELSPEEIVVRDRWE